MNKTVRSQITGRVQGVGYRAWVEREATKRGVHGWVRNCLDGSVEAVFSGPEEDVIDMMMACYMGPPAADVTEVVSDPYRGDLGKGFEIRR